MVAFVKARGWMFILLHTWKKARTIPDQIWQYHHLLSGHMPNVYGDILHWKWTACCLTVCFVCTVSVIVNSGAKIAENETMRKHVNRNIFGTLQDFIPVCASCNNMRDDDGYWVQVVGSCVPQNGGQEFAYCICSRCARKLYPEDYNPKSESAIFVE